MARQTPRKRPTSRRTKAGGPHGVSRLPGLTIDSYNLAIPDPEGDGFLGDRASQTAFRQVLDTVRKVHATGKDPFGRTRSDELSKKDIDLVLLGGDADASHVTHLAVEEYARRLVHVVQRFREQPSWDGVKRIVIGGGMPESQFGQLAIRRAQRMLRSARSGVTLHVLSHDPDEGGLLGWTQLLPANYRRFDAFLAVDVGGTNIRCGIVEPRLSKSADGAKARVIESMQWRHADDDPGRGEAIERLAAMLNGLSAFSRTIGLRLAPFVGIACPGQIEPDGRIPQGAQNLPGDWEAPFHLPGELGRRLDRMGGRVPVVAMHNDAVVQGLSERPRMRGAKRWGVLTIGTGLGNASFTNLRA
ncbi:ROK family protein [Lysobacter soli]|uniref:ROK family protein n=1 Tax=Lysobacter soli TaxID=453783 RepID=UPI0012EE5047|nr:ROK family protein [Lysobacter soli]QGW64474.1 ROK family protein [Lysobacter soli]